MTINLNSRYADGHYSATYPNPRLTLAQRRNGYVGPQPAAPPVVLRSEVPEPKIDAVYRWVQGDRWDTVAAKLGFPKVDWWRILDANPQIEFPTSVRVGDRINVPLPVERRI